MKNRFRFCATWWLDKLLFLQRCVWQYNERFRLTDASLSLSRDTEANIQYF